MRLPHVALCAVLSVLAGPLQAQPSAREFPPLPLGMVVTWCRSANDATKVEPCVQPGAAATSFSSPVALGGSIAVAGTYQQVAPSVSVLVCVTNTSTDVLRANNTGATGTTASTGDELLDAALSAGTRGGRICFGPSNKPVAVRGAAVGSTFNAWGN